MMEMVIRLLIERLMTKALHTGNDVPAKSGAC